ncbi:MAG: formate dehydrogenase accessory sulfurtransferase FdhD [Verrucomicrobiota bacterium]|nr:formate dehydrogenase accessory sulfurtransferase FdhD [Verrucomicrobiota bacterium]
MKSQSKSILRWKLGSKPRECEDEFAIEEPLEIRIDNHPISVTMRTPGHDDELAIGFLVSEGLIKNRKDILAIRPHPKNEKENVINVFLSPDVLVDFKQLTRHVFASSSCGLCGKATIDSVHQHFSKIKNKVSASAKIILDLPKKLRGAQETFDRTGGLHAAAIFDLDGNLLASREDVGRHNAVDKILGYGFLNGVFPFEHHILLVSGRASFEILQKALAARVPFICAVSAPSSLAVEFAQESGQTLVGFLREERMNIYSHPKRIKFD